MFPQVQIASRAMQPVDQRTGGSINLPAPQGALPDDSHSPSNDHELVQLSPVTINIRGELRLPEFFARSWCCRKPAAFVSMPEAAMHETDGTEAGKDDIRSARKVGRVKTKAYASRMQRPAEHELGPGILPFDTRHHPRSSCSIYNICHRETFTFKTEPGMTGAQVPRSR